MPSIMQREPVSPDLSMYQLFVLNKIINSLNIDGDSNIYELVQSAITEKHLLPSSNALVMETCLVLKEYLLAHDFVSETVEMTAYKLTPKGILLKESGSVEQFNSRAAKRRSLMEWIIKIGSLDFSSSKVNKQTTTKNHG